MKKINVGIIGFGLSGKVFHAPLINSMESMEVSKIVTTNPENVRCAKKLYPDAVIVSKANEIFEDDGIDLVVVASPNTYHVDFATKALMTNKHVVVEKPFTITSKEAEELITLSREKKRILTVYQNRRWDSDFLTVKKLVEQNLLGNIVEFESHFDRFRNSIKPNAWREENIPGSGMLYDLGSHLVDQALCLFGLPKEVYADIKIQRKHGKIDDYFEIILFYESTKVILKSSMLVREPLPRFIVLGDKGSFVKYGLDVQESALKDGFFPKNLECWGEEPEEMWGVLNTEFNGLHFRGKIESEKGNYRAFYENLYKAITGEEELQVKPEEAKNTIRVIELAQLSNKNKCNVKF